MRTCPTVDRYQNYLLSQDIHGSGGSYPKLPPVGHIGRQPLRSVLSHKPQRTAMDCGAPQSDLRRLRFSDQNFHQETRVRLG